MNQSKLIKRPDRCFKGKYHPLRSFYSLSGCHASSAYSFVFWFNYATDVFSALLTFTSENQVFTIHFCGFEKDCYRAETSAADNIIEDLLPGPFGYFLPPASGFWCECIFGLNLSYHILFSFSLVGFSTCCTHYPSYNEFHLVLKFKARTNSKVLQHSTPRSAETSGRCRFPRCLRGLDTSVVTIHLIA